MIFIKIENLKMTDIKTVVIHPFNNFNSHF